VSVGAFAHKLLALFGIFAALLIIGVAVYTGLAGPVAQTALRSVVSRAIEFYWANAGPLNLVWQVLGALGTAIFGVFQIVKAWHYAEINLPTRLAEMVKRVFVDQQQLRAEYVDSNMSLAFAELLQPARPKDGWIASFARNIRLLPKTPDQALRTNLRTASDEVNLIKGKLEEYKHQYASALIVAGVDAAREEATQDESDVGLKSPIDHFQQALQVRPDDLDALELTTKQLLLLNGAASDIKKYLKRLCDTAEKQGDLLRHARSLRFRAHYLFTQTKDNKDAPLNEGRVQLENAKSILERAIKVAVKNRTEELARNRELFAQIQMRREKFSAAAIAVADALGHYDQLLEPERSAGQKRVEQINRELQERKKDSESPGA
jgi:hypothetical protein